MTKRSAESTAVEPPVVKNTLFRSPGASSARRSASFAAGPLVSDHGLQYPISMICAAAASAISRRPWPTLTHHMPPGPSISEFPSESVI
jgi:hypothetical protein